MSYFWMAQLKVCPMSERALPVSSMSNEQRVASAVVVSTFKNLRLK